MENTNQKMVKTGDENPVNRTSTKKQIIEIFCVGCQMMREMTDTCHCSVCGEAMN